LHDNLKANAMNQIGKGGTFEDLLQAFLPTQKDFQGDLFIDGGYQQAQVGEDLGINQVGFIDDKEGAFVVETDALKDLQ